MVLMEWLRRVAGFALWPLILLFCIPTHAFVISNGGTPNLTEGWDGPGLGSYTLKWYLGNTFQPNNGLPAGFTMAQVQTEIEAAMAGWSSVIDVTFVKVGDAPTDSANGQSTPFQADTIYIYFASGDHNDGFPFDGGWDITDTNPSTNGFVLAHGFGPPDISGAEGNVHLDSAESWVLSGSNVAVNPPTIDIQSIVLHELGHSLGLTHEDSMGSGANAPVMQSLYWGQLRSLTQDDINGVQSLYAPAREKVCFAPHRGVPGNTNPPVIDGLIENDVGWRGASRLTYGTGTDEPHVAYQLLKDRSQDYLYVSVEVTNDASFDQTDLLILNFRPDAAATSGADDRRLFIYPSCDPDGAAGPACTQTTPADKSNRDPRLVQLWRNSGGWTMQPALPNNTEIKVRSYPDGSTNAWNVELKIPSSTTTGGAGWANFADDFYFYANAVRVSSIDSTATEFLWPRNAPPVNGDVNTFPFAPIEWGTGQKGASVSCNGVWLNSTDVRTTNTPASSIRVTGPPNTITNTFLATVRNNTEVNGTAQVADDVRVRFRIANWGIPGPADWAEIPAANPGCPNAGNSSNPTCTQDVPAASATAPGTQTYQLDWQVADADVGNYQTNDHQCVLVHVDSTSNTNILTSSVYRNMDFVTASVFSRKATISARGYEKPFDGSDQHKFMLNVIERDLDPDKGRGEHEGEMVSRLSWQAHGYRLTGNFIIVDGRRYDLTDAVGSFGYIVQHQGQISGWQSSLEGAKEVASGLYQLDIPVAGAVTVGTSVDSLQERLPNWVKWVLLVAVLLFLWILVRKKFV